MKRIDKSKYEWKKAYIEKMDLMNDRGYVEVSPYDFYRDMFPVGSLQKSYNDGKGNIIATQVRPSGTGVTRQWIVDDSLAMLDKVIGDKFGLVPPISFFGKSHTKKNAHKLFALAIDIDYVGKQQLKNLLKQFGNGIQLRPTYLISSGKGVHVYYFLKEPLDLFKYREKGLAELKLAFIHRLWNDTSSIRPYKPDITGIYQGFRCVGSQTKLGEDFIVRAWKISDNRYTLEDMQVFFERWHTKIDLDLIYSFPKNSSKLKLDEAKERYPDWYKRRVIRKEPKKQNTWVCKKDLYDWWKGKIEKEVAEGGRYFAIMALCAYGLKCGLSEQKIRRDAYAFLEHLDSLTEEDDNHFTKSDVKDALKALKGGNKLLSTIASRDWISKQTKVVISPNKRNYRKQAQHIKMLNAMRVMRRDVLGEDEYKNNGRPSKQQLVQAWREAHPDGKKIDCERETGLSRHTVLKWWK